MYLRRLGAVLLLAAGAGALIAGHADESRMLARMGPELDQLIESRSYHIDPAELLSLMWNNQLRLGLLDVRDESDFNLFHLIDARHFAFTEDDLLWSDRLPDETVRVVMSNDERRANEAWKRLRVFKVPNIYILAGGINKWLELCKPEVAGSGGLRPAHLPRPDAATLEEDVLEYTFPAALGDRYPEARPPAECFSERTYVAKVKVLKPVSVPAGGCGG